MHLFNIVFHVKFIRRFNDGQLPLWVTKSVNDDSALVSETNNRKMLPKGRWALRLTPFTQDGILNLPSSKRSQPLFLRNLDYL